MADTKVSALTPLTGANVAQTTDVLLIVDTSISTDRKITVAELSLAQNVNGTVQNFNGQTVLDFTIPAWATRVTVMGAGLKSNGTSGYIVQLGDSGGIENSGYNGSCTTAGGSVTAMTTGFLFNSVNVSSRIWELVMELTLENPAAFTWMSQFTNSESNSAVTVFTGSGRKSTSAAMTTVRITTVNGTDAGTAGAANVLYS